MLKQTIRTFYEVKDGVVRVAHTDPVLTPLTAKDKKRKAGGRDAKGSNQQKEISSNRSERVDERQNGHSWKKPVIHG